MIGSEGVARALVGKLQSHMPAKLEELKARYASQPPLDPNAPAETVNLIDIQRWYAHDMDSLEIGGFPVILVTETESTGYIGTREVVIGEEADEYTFEYVMRVFCWVTGNSAGGAALALKRYVLAIEEILLYEKLLFSSNDGDQYAKVNPRFVKHSYSDVAIDSEARAMLAAGYVELHVDTRELLLAPAAIELDGPLSASVTVTTDTTLL